MTVADTVKAPKITDYASFINAVRDSGVVGLGGATFPTAVKLDVKDTSRIQEIIINGAECEGLYHERPPHHARPYRRGSSRAAVCSKSGWTSEDHHRH